MDLTTLTMEEKKLLKALFRNRRAFIDAKDLDDLYEALPDVDDILIESWDYVSKMNVYDLTVRARLVLKLRV